MKKALYGIVSIAFLFIFGCAGEMDSMRAELAQLQPKMGVADNIFHSSSPAVKLKLPPGLVFRGKIREGEGDNQQQPGRISDPMEYIFERSSYLFEQTGDDGAFERGILIRIYRVMGNPEQKVPEMFPRAWRPLETGAIKIMKDDYTYRILACPHVLLQGEREIPSNHGAAGCLLAKGLERRAGFGNKSRMQIIYFEPLPQGMPCDIWRDVDNLSQEQKTILSGFIDRSYQGIRFMKKDSVVNAASLYVDKVDMDGGDATTRYTTTPEPEEVETPGRVETPAPEAGAESVVEKRLETLKRLFDKGLITPEDYDTKKAQILEDI
ncbi:MAG: SHOCT domain-containing protein [Deltaproteobacteria bacterium]|nr:SHOCT domain-containing protein [Deltaproteobacteria bacterium]